MKEKKKNSIKVNKKTVAWSPVGAGQLTVASCPVEEILIHGDRGGGKTDLLLYLYLRNVGKGYGLDYLGIIFKQEFKYFTDLIKKSKKMIPKIFPKARFFESASSYKWKFEGGEELLFRHAKNESDYEQFHGWEIPFIGFDELTKFPNLDFYHQIKSCLRSPIVDLPKLIVSTTNPSGVSHNEVKSYFIDKANECEVIEDEGMKRTHIKVSFLQNPFIFDNDPDYIKRLRAIKDPYLRDAWLNGSWDIISGGAFDDLWDKSIHVYDYKDIVFPKHWQITRGFDWGQSAPFSVGWYITCPDDEVINWGKGTRRVSKGTIFRIFEFYGAIEGKKNKGLRWTNTKMVDKIIEIEKAHNWDVKAGVADSAIFADPTKNDKSIYDVFKNKGIKFLKSSKGAGSRMARMSVTRDRLESSFAETMEAPAFFVSNLCKQTIIQLPLLKRDAKNIEEVDTIQEDHLYDELSYQFLNYDKYGIAFTL